MRAALALVAAVTMPVFIAGQSIRPEDSRPRFETASVKPNTSPDAGINNRFSPGRFVYVNTPLWVLITLAYSIPSERVLDMPDA